MTESGGCGSAHVLNRVGFGRGWLRSASDQVGMAGSPSSSGLAGAGVAVAELARGWAEWLAGEEVLPGTPFLVSPMFEYDVALNEFFRSTRMLCAARNTQMGYARDVAAFLNFLWSRLMNRATSKPPTMATRPALVPVMADRNGVGSVATAECRSTAPEVLGVCAPSLSHRERLSKAASQWAGHRLGLVITARPPAPRGVSRSCGGGPAV